MKFKNIALTTFMIIGSFSMVRAQCDTSVKVESQKVSTLSGTIKVKIRNSPSYSYILYAYDKGDKKVVETKSGSKATLEFNDLAIDKYYRVELHFNNVEKSLCKNWVSELIEFKD